MAEPHVFINVWEWMYDFHARARRNGDQMRAQLKPLFDATSDLIESRPDEAISRFQHGRSLAQALNEPLWVLLFDNHISQILIWSKRDVAAGMDLAVRVAVSANSPEHRRWPFNPRVQYALLSAYCFYDPLSFRDEIRNGVSYLENELDYDQDVWRLVVSITHSLYCREEYLTAALNSVHEYLNRSAGSSYFLSNAYYLLCLHHFIAGNYADLRTAAQLGVGHARLITDRKYRLIKLQLWQAIAALALEGATVSQGYYHAALNTMHSIGDTFQRDRVDNLALYFELIEDFDSALTQFDENVATARLSGSPYCEYIARLGRCRLLKIMGRLTEDEIAATRGARNRLKYPDRYPPRLEKIVAGDTSHFL
jgi:hypothetical protein